MSVFEVGVYFFNLALEHWDWYLLIGIILSIAFTNWDMKRHVDKQGSEVLVDLFEFFGVMWIGVGVLFIFNAALWPFEMMWRIYRALIEAIAKPLFFRL